MAKKSEAKKSFALLDTRVISCGDNLEQLQKLPEARVDLVNSFLKRRRPLLQALEYPIWNYIIQTFDYTRSYDQGLVFAMRLLAELEKNRKDIPRNKFGKYLYCVWHFIFSNLDKLDRWEDYLLLWKKLESIRIVRARGTDEIDTGKSVLVRDETIKAFETLFLFLDHRKAVIERKLEKQKNGARLGNLFHERQTDLTTEEIRERFEWIMNFRLTGVYDFNPPASRQRRMRPKATKQTNQRK